MSSKTRKNFNKLKMYHFDKLKMYHFDKLKMYHFNKLKMHLTSLTTVLCKMAVFFPKYFRYTYMSCSSIVIWRIYSIFAL